MARDTEFITGIYVPASEGDGVSSTAIVGVIPSANLPPEPPPTAVEQYTLPDDLQHLERELAFDTSTIVNGAWRLGNDANGITLANTCLLYTSPSPRD